jgi:hypothetical protein
MSDKHCVLICGFARAGKDTFAKGIIAGARAAKRMAYADNLKNALNIAAQHLGVEVDYHRDEDKAIDRDLLVEFGRAMRRRDIDVFAKQLARDLEDNDTASTIVVPDWRYLNEYKVAVRACKEYGYKLHTVQVVRHGWKSANAEEQMSMDEVQAAVPMDETHCATSGDEESVLLAGIRTAKLWNL